ncbi:MAG: HalX domain-containing protein [Haloarculaceae archaeon]
MNRTPPDVLATDDAVLVCASDDAVRFRVRRALQREWPVRTAVTAREAVASLGTRISVVVLDDADSGFAAALARREHRPLVEVVGLLERGADATAEWFDASVRKPFEDRELRAAVERLQRRVRYDRLLRRYYAMANDYAGLAARAGEADPAELSHLRERLTEVREELDALAATLDDGDAIDVAVRSFEPGRDDPE